MSRRIKTKTEQASVPVKGKPSKHKASAEINRASMSKHAKTLGKLGGRPRGEKTY